MENNIVSITPSVQYLPRVSCLDQSKFSNLFSYIWDIAHDQGQIWNDQLPLETRKLILRDTLIKSGKCQHGYRLSQGLRYALEFRDEQRHNALGMYLQPRS